jgi:hypothetical protein
MPIERVLLPGKKLMMSMIFELPLLEHHCPRCSGPAFGKNRHTMKCDGCCLEFSISFKETAVEDVRNEPRFERPSNS